MFLSDATRVPWLWEKAVTHLSPMTRPVAHEPGPARSRRSGGTIAAPAAGASIVAGDPTVALRNIRMMHFLERIAIRFNDAGIPLMVLKGAALNLTLYANPGDRPMSDLDLMVRPEDLDRVLQLMENAGCLCGEPLVREDFFPRFHYERELKAGTIYPVMIDLHIRPLRPLRFARTVPGDAFWSRARAVPIGRASVLAPSPEDMLIHLAAHSAIHANSRMIWLVDIRAWVAAHVDRFDWDAVIETSCAWKLVLPVLDALEAAVREVGLVCPPDVLRRMRRVRVSWRDRLLLRQAPRDAAHPAAHVLTSALCTPDWRFALSYLVAALLPDRQHMADWYGKCHVGWLPVAHMLRVFSPVLKKVPGFSNWLTRIETRPSRVHGTGVFARRDFQPGEVIARYQGRPVERHGMYVGWTETRDDGTQHYEITGKLRFLNHSCRPNARLSNSRLIAMKTIMVGDELTIDYGPDACSCRRDQEQDDRTCTGRTAANAA